MASIFISYRRNSTSKITGRIYDSLVKSFPSEMIFRDMYSMPLGIQFPEYLKQKVKECTVFIIIIERNWASSFKKKELQFDYVLMEIETALDVGLPIIPVTISHAPFPTELELPKSICSITRWNSQNVEIDEYFHYDMSRLINRIKPLIQTELQDAEPKITKDLIQQSIDIAQNWFNEIIETRGKLLTIHDNNIESDYAKYTYIYTRKYLPRLISIRKLLSIHGQTSSFASSIDNFLKLITFTISDLDEKKGMFWCVPIALYRDSKDPSILFVHNGEYRIVSKVIWALTDLCEEGYKLLNAESSFQH